MMRILVAGIGNVFLADDGFGVEVVRLLAGRPLPEGVEVADFGIRGMDLAYALMENHDAVIFLDTAMRGGEPGDLYLIEHHPDESGEVTIDAHGMDPVKVLGLARALGATPTRTFVVACEPLRLLDGANDPEMEMGLTDPVLAAVHEAVAMVEALIDQLIASNEPDVARPPGGVARPSVAAQ